ncbi:MAG: Fe-S cluster assembly protein SufD [Cyclobacteriaceae bacterium]
MEVVDRNTEELLINHNSRLLETDPLGGLRQAARETFLKLGLPAKKAEAYKYTPITRVLGKNFDFTALTKPATSWTKEACHDKFYPNAEANHLVFTNGLYNQEFSKIKSSSADLVIETIDSQSFENIADLKQNLGALTDDKQDAFAWLNLATFSQGLFLHSLKNKDNLPTYIYHFNDAPTAAISMPRVLALVESGSRLRVYEKTFRSGEANHLTNSLVEVDVKANGELRWTKLQNQTMADYAIEGFYGIQERDSRVYTNTFTFKTALTRNNLYLALDAENCETHMHGLYHLNQNSHVDNYTSVDHTKPNSFSNELYKGIVDEKAHAVFNGKIYVRPQAQKTNAFQSNNNIILSDDAKVNTKPQLEIWADDVKCSHGCTTGQLDEEAIFYLRSRGIAKQQAKALMLNAFASETVQEVQDEHIRTEVENLILNKLGV